MRPYSPNAVHITFATAMLARSGVFVRRLPLLPVKLVGSQSLHINLNQVAIPSIQSVFSESVLEIYYYCTNWLPYFAVTEVRIPVADLVCLGRGSVLL